MLFKLTIFMFVLMNYYIQSIKPNYKTCSSYSFNPNDTILNTLNGKIKGECYIIPINYANETRTENKILIWLSIPYADAPINSLRFNSPQPVKSWIGIINGLDFPFKCIQVPGLDSNNSDEDCLYLNIYAPYNSLSSSSSGLPIYVLIHGGSFILGSSSNYDGSRIAIMSNIIVITINYRLGPFGFFYVKDTDARGNQALRDQQLALKWIYENSVQIGGDQNRITIGGESAGSWSVGYHLLYKDSWNYFNNAILQSGNPVTLDIGTKFLTQEEAHLISIKTGNLIGCTNRNGESLLACLQSQTVSAINSASYKHQSFPTFVLDSDVIDQEPKVLFQNGNFKKCNILAGYNNYEEVSLAEYEIFDFIQDIKKGDLNALKNALKLRLTLDDSIIVNKIIDFYFQNEPKNSNDYYLGFINMITDYQYQCPTYQLAEYYSSYKQNAFVYIYGHKLSKSSNDPAVDGASHAEELSIIFAETSKDNSFCTDEEKKFSEQLVSYWTSFIVNGTPNEWKRFNYYENSSLFKRNFLFLKSNNISNQVYLTEEPVCNFWKNLNMINSFHRKKESYFLVPLTMIFCILNLNSLYYL